MTTTLDEAFQHLSSISSNVTQRIYAEDGADPFAGLNLAGMQAIAADVDRAIGKLEVEGKLFCGEADLGAIPDIGLDDLLAETRAGSRKLAVGIAKCTNFGVHSSSGPIVLPGSTFYSAEVIEELSLKGPNSKLDELLKACYAANTHTYQAYYGHHQANRTDPPKIKVSKEELSSSAANAARLDSAASMAELKTMSAAVTAQLEALQLARETKALEKKSKAELAAKIESTVAEKLIPLLKKHVLRVGVGKGRVAAPSDLENLLSTCDHSLVEEVHRELDETGDRVVEEKALRKMERRAKEHRVDDGASVVSKWDEVGVVEAVEAVEVAEPTEVAYAMVE